MPEARRLPFVIAALTCAFLIAGVAVVVTGEGARAERRGRGSTAEDVATRLVGKWTGTKSGAEGGKFASDAWRVVIKASKANAVIGTKQYRQPNGHWSKAEVVNAVVDATGHIWGADTDGIINGSLSDAGTLELVYLEPGTTDGAAAIAVLTQAGG